MKSNAVPNLTDEELRRLIRTDPNDPHATMKEQARHELAGIMSVIRPTVPECSGDLEETRTKVHALEADLDAAQNEHIRKFGRDAKSGKANESIQTMSRIKIQLLMQRGQTAAPVFPARERCPGRAGN